MFDPPDVQNIFYLRHCLPMTLPAKHLYLIRIRPSRTSSSGRLPWAGGERLSFLHAISLINIFLRTAFFFLSTRLYTHRIWRRTIHSILQYLLCPAFECIACALWLDRWWCECHNSFTHFNCTSACEAIWQDQRDYNSNTSCQYSSFTHNWSDKHPAASCFLLSFPTGYYGYVSRDSSGFFDGIGNGEASRISEQ